MQLFEEIESKGQQVKTLKALKPLWFTWSPDFFKEFSVRKKELSALTVKLVHFDLKTEYNYTYDIETDKMSAETQSFFDSCAAELCKLPASSRVYFFTGLINKQVSHTDFQKLFCALRRK